MRVVINQLAGLKRKAGVGHYATELVDALRGLLGGEHVVTYPEGWVRSGCEQFFRSAGSAGPSSGGRWSLGATWRHWARALGRTLVSRHFGRCLARVSVDLYHEPNFVPLPCDRPTVVTIHDLSVLRHPEWHPADRVRYYERYFLPRLRQCCHVLTVSEAVRREVIAELDFAPDCVSRAYHGVPRDLHLVGPKEIFRVRQLLGLPEEYLLHVGTIEPRKNLGMLLRMYCSLPASVRERCGLVLAGAWGWKSADIAAYYEQEARHRGVRHVGYVADEDLAGLYSGARALVFPTRYEGFGFPTLEMMACGGAVLASDDPAVAEIAGRRAHHIPAQDEDGWRTAMQRMITDADWRRSLRVGVREHARRFTWERCANETLNAYHRALSRAVPMVESPALAESAAAA